MSQDLNDQAIFSEELGIEQCDEQELQVITGGCIAGCGGVVCQAIETRNGIQLLIADNSPPLTNSAKYTLSKATGEYNTLANSAASSMNKLPKYPSGVCEDYPKHANDLMNLNTRMFGGKLP